MGSKDQGGRGASPERKTDLLKHRNLVRPHNLSLEEVYAQMEEEFRLQHLVERLTESPDLDEQTQAMADLYLAMNGNWGDG